MSFLRLLPVSPQWSDIRGDTQVFSGSVPNILGESERKNLSKFKKLDFAINKGTLTPSGSYQNWGLKEARTSEEKISANPTKLLLYKIFGGSSALGRCFLRTMWTVNMNTYGNPPRHKFGIYKKNQGRRQEGSDCPYLHPMSSNFVVFDDLFQWICGNYLIFPGRFCPRFSLKNVLDIL